MTACAHRNMMGVLESSMTRFLAFESAQSASLVRGGRKDMWSLPNCLIISHVLLGSPCQTAGEYTLARKSGHLPGGTCDTVSRRPSSAEHLI